MPHPQRLASLLLGGPAEPWRQLGFDVEDFTVGATAFETDETLLPGIRGWSLVGAGDEDIGDLLTDEADAQPPARTTPHPNGVIGIDHVVVVTPSLQRTTAAFEAVGVPCRRVREAGPVTQGFFRLGEVVVEVVEPAERKPSRARFWGVTLVVEDLDATVAHIGPERLTTPKDAVQPGRRIVTVRKEAGHGVPLALMTPGPH